MAERMAIMKNVDVGQRDAPWVVLSFDVYIDEGIAALQCISMKDPRFEEILSSVYSIKNLEGKACLVEDEGTMIRFLKVMKL